MPASKRRHSPSSPNATGLLPPASPTHHASYHFDRYPSTMSGDDLPPSSIPTSPDFSSPKKMGPYRDNDTDTDESDDDVEEALGFFDRAAPTRADMRARHERRLAKGKGRAILGRRLTSGNSMGPSYPSVMNLGTRSRYVSPSIYNISQGMSSLHTSSDQSDEEAVSSALVSERRSSSPSPVPSSPDASEASETSEASEIDTPTRRPLNQPSGSRVLITKRKKWRHPGAIKAADALRKSRLRSWEAAEEEDDLDSIQNIVEGNLAPHAAAPDTTTEDNGAGPSHERHRESSAESASGSGSLAPPLSVTAMRGDAGPSRKHVRVQSPPLASSVAFKTPTRAVSNPEARTPTDRAVTRTPSTPTRPSVSQPTMPTTDWIDDVVLETASEEEPEPTPTPTPTKPQRRMNNRQINQAPETTTRNRYANPVPQANRTVVPKAGHTIERSRYKFPHWSRLVPGPPTTRLRLNQALELLPKGLDLVPPLHVARRRQVTQFVSWRPNWRPNWRIASRDWSRLDSDRRHRTIRVMRGWKRDPKDDDMTYACHGERFTLHRHKSTIRARVSDRLARYHMMQRHRERTLGLTLTTIHLNPVGTTNHRRTYSSPDDSLAVEDLLGDVEMLDSDEWDAVDLALSLPSQSAPRRAEAPARHSRKTFRVGRKRSSFPKHDGATSSDDEGLNLYDESEVRTARQTHVHMAASTEFAQMVAGQVAKGRHARKFRAANPSLVQMATARAHQAFKAQQDAQREAEAQAYVEAMIAAEERRQAALQASAVAEAGPAPTAFEQQPVRRSSDAVEDILFEAPMPVEVVESRSEPAQPVQQQTTADVVEDASPVAAESARQESSSSAANRSAAHAARERRRRQLTGLATIESITFSDSHLSARRLVAERRRASAASEGEGEAEAGPSRVRVEEPVVEEEPEAGPGPSSRGESSRFSGGESSRFSGRIPAATSLSRASTAVQPSTPTSASVPTQDEAPMSPPPRYEYPFFPIIRSQPRHLAPTTLGRQSAAAREEASNPPPYVNEYSRTSPAPPPPYNAQTDCRTLIEPVFLREPPRPGTSTARGQGGSIDSDLARQRETSRSNRDAPPSWQLEQQRAGPSGTQATRRGRQLAAAASSASHNSEMSDDELRAPGTWPRERRRTSTRTRSREDVEMVSDDAQEQSTGTIASFGRWLGLWH